MASPVANSPVPPEIRAALTKLRARIRAYVTLEGLAVGAIWVAGTFWIALALDYLPILVGATELPQIVRAIILTAIVVVLAAIVYRQVVRRLFVRLADRSMAILLERRYRDFRDSLVTTVELADRSRTATDFNPELLTHTSAEALRELSSVRFGQLFNLRPLAVKVALAAGLVGSLVVMATVSGDMFSCEPR